MKPTWLVALHDLTRSPFRATAKPGAVVVLAAVAVAVVAAVSAVLLSAVSAGKAARHPVHLDMLEYGGILYPPLKLPSGKLT